MYETDMETGTTIAGHRADAHVPRTLVHKAADSEVLLSSVRPLADDRYAVWVRWPHDHLLYRRGTDGTRDSLVVVETLRQAGIYLSHRFHDVPMDHAFVLHGFSFQLDTPIRDTGDGSDVVFEITVCREAGNPRRFRMSCEARIRVGGRPAGRATMRWDAVAPRQYQTLRSRGIPVPRAAASAVHPPRPLTPQAVGRDREDAVVLADSPETDGGWQLVMDTRHPALFDHASDHVAGMVIVEAFRQAALVRTGHATPGSWAVTGIQMGFESFGELDARAVITAEPEGPDTFRLTARQGPRTLATARVTGSSTSPLGKLIAQAGVATC
ncbi:ScbA/BarX family gamma-butyrolactone biosynthesis protein [Streptomyces tsukubensis]|uniref:A-factor biosynthesis hotdog domain-containing protein n=1 Tax=Streptomyces tsukubensis TaxID=83656 RepID=A0A1V4A562_9ACTN|nr:ScbA/BarX family gamma-butyrolactone biosynthesis protein [Streptomyces tsukubensis]OON75383.1 hypothetical protein B1H18_23165 [Streptomyces tsukubensis]